MANELSYPGGLAVTLQFSAANPGAGATAAMKFVQGGVGLKVPPGYKFHPLCLHGESNADLTAGTATFKVTADTTALANGPQAALADTVQVAVGVKGVGAEPIAAGAIVGVSVTTDAGYLPVTADMDAVLIGLLLPA
jgi:hypothetical protein